MHTYIVLCWCLFSISDFLRFCYFFFSNFMNTKLRREVDVWMKEKRTLKWKISNTRRTMNDDTDARKSNETILAKIVHRFFIFKSKYVPKYVYSVNAKSVPKEQGTDRTHIRHNITNNTVALSGFRFSRVPASLFHINCAVNYLWLNFAHNHTHTHTTSESRTWPSVDYCIIHIIPSVRCLYIIK